MKVSVKKGGNSVAICLAGNIARWWVEEKNMKLDLKVKEDQLILPYVRENEFSELINRITPENLHHSNDTGERLGKEVW